MIAGAVLTGGRSRRFGRDKCQEVFHGKRLVEIAFEKLKQVVDDVYVIGKDYGLGKFIPDVYPFKGPLNAIYSFFAFNPSADGVIVLPCDTPLVPIELLKFIKEKSNQADIVIPRYENFYEPLIGYYSRRTFKIAAKLIGNDKLSMMNLINDQNLKVFPVGEDILRTFGDPEIYFTNINYPEDLTRALEIE